MTQQEFEHIYYFIKADLIRLAGQFCRSASPAIESEDLKRSRSHLITFRVTQALHLSLKWQMSVSSSNGSMTPLPGRNVCIC